MSTRSSTRTATAGATPYRSDDATVIDRGYTATAAAATSTTTTAPAPSIITYLVPVVSGMLFGAAFQLSRVHEFYFIRRQMQMKDFLMLKMFLSAAGTSLLVLGFLLPLVSSLGRSRISHWSNVMSCLVADHRGVPALFLGAGLLGAGICISCSCPGTVFAQLAAGSVLSRWTLAGGLAAGAFYPLFDLIPGYTNALKSGQAPWQKLTLDAALGGQSKARVSVGLAAMFATIVAVCEYFSPWQAELQEILPVSKTNWPDAIPPYAAGVIVGLLQLPLILLVNNHLGCSSSYITVIANLIGLASPSTAQKIPLFKSLGTNWWQVFLMFGVFLGALLSSTVTGASFASDSLLRPSEAFLGGVLLVSGSRIAAGCTSGHGISGMGYLSLNSFIAVAGMFGTGMAVGFLVY